eukprot:gene13113-3650_t
MVETRVSHLALLPNAQYFHSMRDAYDAAQLSASHSFCRSAKSRVQHPAMSSKRRNYGTSSVLEKSTPSHCIFAFDTLIMQLSSQSSPERAFPDAHTALFVTWKLHSTQECADSHPHLRGCIGTLEPRPLRSALHDYALTSALRDTRFDPIALQELPHLQVTISLISCFEEAGNCYDWSIGVHGLIIEFKDPMNGSYHTATFLPEVAPEQGWDHKACIRALVKKSGYSGSINQSLLDVISTTRYRLILVSMYA